MGDKLVVINPGGGTSNEQVKNGEELSVVNPLDVDKILSKFTKITDNAGDLVEGLANIVNKVNSGQGSIGRLLNNDKMARNMENTVKQAQTTMANVHQTSSTLNEDLTAAQHNFLLKGFFKKKQKAKDDSLKKLKQDSTKKAQDKAAKQ
jgi:phospholipid/cholesterol/gamma-HCH transport system substrate-binding protein